MALMPRINPECLLNGRNSRLIVILLLVGLQISSGVHHNPRCLKCLTPECLLKAKARMVALMTRMLAPDMIVLWCNGQRVVLGNPKARMVALMARIKV
jgi:hypothetical protein